MRSRAPVRTPPPGSTRRGRRSTCSRRSGACARPRRSATRVVAMRGERSVLVRDVADVREGGGVQARRRVPQRQAGGDRRRAEAAGRQHDRGDRAARPRSSTRCRRSCRAASRSTGGSSVRPTSSRSRSTTWSTALRDGGILVIVDRAAVPCQPARGGDHADRDAAVACRRRSRRCAPSAPASTR